MMERGGKSRDLGLPSMKEFEAREQARKHKQELEELTKSNERKAKRQMIIGLVCLCLISFCVSVIQEVDNVNVKLRETIEKTKSMIPFREARGLEPNNNAQLLWEVLMSQSTTGVEMELREGTELYAVVRGESSTEDVVEHSVQDLGSGEEEGSGSGDGGTGGSFIGLAAQLTLMNDKIHLHALRNHSKPLPSDAMTLPYGAIYERVGTGSVLTFLELGWDGKSRGRVYIRMLGATDRARQFTRLLTNEHGYSYLNGTFLQFMNKGAPGQYVTSGAYDGKGGAPPLIDGLIMGGPYRHPWRAGLVMGVWENRSAQNAKFGIVLKSWADSESQLGFGQVEQGLDLLIHAANRIALSDILIMDCGFIVPT